MSEKKNEDLERLKEWLDHGIPELVRDLGENLEARSQWNPDLTEEEEDEVNEIVERCDEVATEVQNVLDSIESLLSDMGLV